MPFDRCIAAALADQLLTAEEADQYREIYDEQLAGMRPHMPGNEAAAEAARATFNMIEGDAAESRRRTFLTLAARDDITRRLEGFVSPISGKKNPYAAAKATLSHITKGRRGEVSVEGAHAFWHGQAMDGLDEAFRTWKRNALGVRKNLPRMANIVREAFGENTNDAAAKSLAKGWAKSSEKLRQAFNRFGGHIAMLEDWGLPQSHDATTVRRAGFETWRQFVTPLLDRARMLDRRTGKPLTDEKLQTVLHDVYQSIVTGGWAGRDATANAGGGLANRRGEARVLHFANADNWLSYQTKFGNGSPVDAMLGHVDKIARDVALMQVLGPNPKSSISWLKNELKRRYALAQKQGDVTFFQRAREHVKNDAVAAGDAIDNMYASFTHANSNPSSPLLADIGDDIANLATAAQIPGVVPMALTGDFNTARFTAKANGLPFTLAMKEYLAHFNPLDAEHRALARGAGLEAQHYGRSLAQTNRFQMQIAGHEWSRWLSDRALAASGLTAHTAAGRESIGLAFYRHIAGETAEKNFAQLDDKFRALLERGGIDAQDWRDIRKTVPHTLASGAQYIRPGDILDRADLDPSRALTLAGKVADIAGVLAEEAVPASTLQGRAAFAGQNRRGTLRYLAAQSLAMYHQYGTSMMLTHGLESFARGTPGRGARYAAGLIVSSTLAGALALQLKEIANGRDPRDMTDWRFWANAMAYGGGGGILADFIYAGLQGTSRTGKGLAETLAGSPVGLVSDFINTLFGNPLGVAAKNPHNTPGQNYALGWIDFTKRYMPGGNMWWGRLLLERYVWDTMQESIDPNYKSRVNRIERWYRGQYGNGYYWHHGESAPERAPDLSAAVGGARP
jgi:hypothetical protein